LLRETLIAGEVPRGRAAELTGYGERMARTVVSELLKKGLLKSASARGPLTLAFLIDVVERWFPLLYTAEDLASANFCQSWTVRSHALRHQSHAHPLPVILSAVTECPCFHEKYRR